jgi:hypothetical protein
MEEEMDYNLVEMVVDKDNPEIIINMEEEAEVVFIV